MTQTELGQRLGVTHAQVSRLESGKYEWTVPTLIEVARVFDCNVTSLMPGYSIVEDPTIEGPDIDLATAYRAGGAYHVLATLLWIETRRQRQVVDDLYRDTVLPALAEVLVAVEAGLPKEAVFQRLEQEWATGIDWLPDTTEERAERLAAVIAAADEFLPRLQAARAKARQTGGEDGT